MSLTYVTKKLEDQTLEEGELGGQKVRFQKYIYEMLRGVKGGGRNICNLSPTTPGQFLHVPPF